MSDAALVSVEEYLRSSEKPSREYRDGVLYPKPLTAFLHGIVALQLMLIPESGGTNP